MEVFLWDTTEEAKTINKKKKDMAADEIADVYIFLLLICHELGLDLEKLPEINSRKTIKSTLLQNPRDRRKNIRSSTNEIVFRID